MLIRRVVHHHIHDHADVALTSLRYEPVKVRHRAILRVDVFVIRDVVTEINLRRGIAGGQPDCIYAQFFQIVKLLRDPI